MQDPSPEPKIPQLTLHEEPEQRVLRINWRGQAPALASIHNQDRAMGVRLDSLLKAGTGICTLLRKRHHSGSLVMQLHDEDPLIPCIRLDASNDDVHDLSRPLIPDPYCLMTNGYRTLREEMRRNPLPPWHQRLQVAFWRGSTTGSKDIDPYNLSLNRRYQLARLSQIFPDHLDARINRVVQCKDSHSRKQVEDQLHQEGILSSTVSPWHAALHAWQIDIDGNVNSWGLLWKLLSGSCILRVQSPRYQWYHHRLKPWVHLVPIQADLSDLYEQLTWCSNHRQECAAIASAGQSLAMQVVQEIDEALLTAGVRYSQAWM